MPIYAPSLPPKPDLTLGRPPALVIGLFDLQRIRRQKLGAFFGFVLLMFLIIRLSVVYLGYLKDHNQLIGQLMAVASPVMAQGAEWHADMLGWWLTHTLWFIVAMFGGSLVARDTLYRTRPLIYAHPARPRDYWIAKVGVASLIPFLIQLPFILLPWGLALGTTGIHGVMWLSAPLLLLPAALVIALLMGSVSAGASSLASSPRAGFSWVIGLVLGLHALGYLLWTLLGSSTWMAISPMALAPNWPRLLCGANDMTFGWGPTLIGTAAHFIFWTLILKARTRPSEAVL